MTHRSSASLPRETSSVKQKNYLAFQVLPGTWTVSSFLYKIIYYEDDTVITTSFYKRGAKIRGRRARKKRQHEEVHKASPPNCVGGRAAFIA